MDSKSINTFLVVAVALLAIAVGYSSLLRERSQRVDVPDAELASEVSKSLDEERFTSVEAGNSEVNLSQEPVGPGGLHQELMVMPERDRNNLFRLAIRDAGFQCDDVTSSQFLSTETGVWQADCGAMSTYSLLIHEFGGISISPIPYGDFPPVQPE